MVNGIGSEGGTSERMFRPAGTRFGETLTPVVMGNRAQRGAGGAGGGGGAHKGPDYEGLVGHLDEFDHSGVRRKTVADFHNQSNWMCVVKTLLTHRLRAGRRAGVCCGAENFRAL